MKIIKKILMGGIILSFSVFLSGRSFAAPLKLDADGHLGFLGNSPTLANCGSGVVVLGSTDNAGELSIPSGSTNPCTVVFSNPYDQSPTCVITTQVPTVFFTNIDTAQFVIDSSSSGQSFAGAVWYHCFAL